VSRLSRPRTRGKLLIHVGLVLTCVAVLNACTTGPTDPEPQPIKDFLIAGEVTGLYPGGQSEVPVEVQNPNSSELMVTDISVVASDGSTQCGAAYLSVGNIGGPVAVPPLGRATIRLPVSLAESAPDACQGVTFPLVFSGEGVVQ